MGFFSAIGSFLGFVNNNETAAGLAKDISTGLDKSFYTSQEKTQDKLEATKTAMEAWLRMVESMKASEAYRSITRRFLSVFIIVNLFMLIWICVASEIVCYFGWFGSLTRIIDPSVAKDAIQSISLTPITWSILKIAGAFELGWVFCTIIVFYFGPQLAQILIGRKNVKNDK